MGRRFKGNVEFYQAIAPHYASIYGDVDCDEVVRQWFLLLGSHLDQDPASGCEIRLIDIGCGPGEDLLVWSRLGFTVVGLDSSETMADTARARLAGVQGSVLTLDIRDVVDGSVSPLCRIATARFNFLNLFPAHELRSVFRGIGHCLEKGGVWMTDFSTPAAMPAGKTENAFEKLKLLCVGESRAGGQYAQRWRGNGLDTLEHYWLHSVATVLALAQREGWQVLDLREWAPHQTESPWRSFSPEMKHAGVIFQKPDASQRPKR